MLRIVDGPKKWTIFTLDNLMPRCCPMFCALNEDQLLIAGGLNNEENPMNDALVFNKDNYEQRTGKVVSHSEFSFYCQGGS